MRDLQLRAKRVNVLCYFWTNNLNQVVILSVEFRIPIL
jgi:hypothetical protein